MPALELTGRRVLLAYGLLGELRAGLRPLGLDYMDAQATWLRGQGARVAIVSCPTVAPVARNAARIRHALLSAAEPALLIGHSKGGLESLAALTDPAAAARCTGLIALQSPFAGSPVADAVVASRALHGLADAAARLLRLGTGEGVRDLTAAARVTWWEEHAGAVAALLARVPVVCLATTVDPRATGPDAAYRLMARRLAAAGAGPSDGLVPLASALLPGAIHVTARGGHLAAAAEGRGRDPVGLLARALAALPA